MARIAWHGISATNTDEEAYEFARLLWGLPSSFIELRRTGGALLLRPDRGGAMDDELNLFIKRKYPPPKSGEPFYNTYKAFGHWLYLVKAYPEVWAASGTTFAHTFEGERQDMYWEQIEEETGPLNGKIEPLTQFLRGNSIIILKEPTLVVEGQGDQLEDEGVAVWENETGKVMCIFTDAEGNLIPRLMYSHEVEITDFEFEGW